MCFVSTNKQTISSSYASLANKQLVNSENWALDPKLKGFSVSFMK